MTYGQKKQLYEKIMQDVAKTVARVINESSNHLNESFKSGVMNDFIKYCSEYAKEHNTFITLKLIYFDSQVQMLNIKKDGSYSKGINRFNISDLTDDNLYKEKYFDLEGIKKVLQKNSDRIQTRDFVDFMKSRHLYEKGLSCVIAETWSRYEIIGALFINKGGTLQIKNMIDKHNQREKEKNNDKKLTANQSKIDYQRQMFQLIKKDYDNFKEKYGDKAAIELGKVVNNMFKDDRVKSVLRQQLQNETDMKKYLYGFMLKREDTFGFMDFMEKHKGLCNIRDEFYKRLDK